LATRKAGIERLAQKLIPKLRKLDVQRRMGGPRTLDLTASGGNKTTPAKPVTAQPSPAATSSSSDKKPNKQAT